jgi:peptidoglycan biosynthesis protein MviN/MurJ (putative lipid II flippase)
MKYSQSLHWKIFNVLGRIVGVGFVIGGLILAIYGLVSHDWLGVLMPSIMAILGILLIKAKPYKPN